MRLFLACVPWLLSTSCFAVMQHAHAERGDVNGTVEAEATPLLQEALRSRLTVHVHPRTGERTVTRHCRHAAEGCDTRLAEFARYLFESGEQYGVDQWLLAAMAFRESGLNPFAVGTRGEKGILQLHPKNRRVQKVRFVQDESYRTRCQQQAGACQREVVERAAFILASSLVKCGGDLEQALGMYNTGRCGGSLTYAKRVLKERARLMSLAGVDAALPASPAPLRVAASPRAGKLSKPR
jgi:hypothetical protein